MSRGFYEKKYNAKRLLMRRDEKGNLFGLFSYRGMENKLCRQGGKCSYEDGGCCLYSLDEIMDDAASNAFP